MLQSAWWDGLRSERLHKLFARVDGRDYTQQLERLLKEKGTDVNTDLLQQRRTIQWPYRILSNMLEPVAATGSTDSDFKCESGSGDSYLCSSAERISRGTSKLLACIATMHVCVCCACACARVCVPYTTRVQLNSCSRGRYQTNVASFIAPMNPASGSLLPVRRSYPAGLSSTKRCGFGMRRAIASAPAAPMALLL